MKYFDLNMELSEEDMALQDAARQFAEKEMRPVAKKLDLMSAEAAVAEDSPLWEFLKKSYSLGYHKILLPEYYGGLGLSPLQTNLIFEELAWGSFGLALLTTVVCFPFYLICVTNDEELIEQFVVPFCNCTDGSIRGCWGITEPEHGSDHVNMGEDFFSSPNLKGNVRAKLAGDEYVINGLKCWSTNGPVASLFTVFASTQPELKHKGISVFMVPKSKNVKIGHIENKVGQLNSIQSEVIFEDARVPEECLVGKEGDGFKIAMMTLDKTRAGIAAIATGVAQRAVDEAAKFANIRHQFGQPIGRFQGISFTLADMGAKTAAARWQTRHAAWLADQGLPNSKDSAFAKFFASDTAMQNAIEWVQIMGGYGYITEYPAEKLMRDAKLLQIYEGTNEVQRLVAGNAILKESINLDTGFRFKYDGKDAPAL